MFSNNDSLEKVFEVFRQTVIVPNFETDDEFEIISTIRYDPNLTHVFISVSQFEEDIDNKLQKQIPYGLGSTSNLFSDSETTDGQTGTNSTFLNLLSILENPVELTTLGANELNSHKDFCSIFKRRCLFLKEHQERLNLTMSYFKWEFEIPMSLLLNKIIDAIPVDEGQQIRDQTHRMEILLNSNQSYKIRLSVSKHGNMRIETYPLSSQKLLSHDTQNYFAETLFSGFFSDQDIWDIYIDSQPIVISPFTTFKTNKRQHYDNARNRMEEMAKKSRASDKKKEILLYNEAFQLTEGSVTNVCVKKYISETEYCFMTPFLSSGCLCGVMRHFLLQKGLIHEQAIDVRDLKVGDTVIIFNSLMGCVKGIIRKHL